jgi:hypothetical protein
MQLLGWLAQSATRAPFTAAMTSTVARPSRSPDGTSVNVPMEAIPPPTAVHRSVSATVSAPTRISVVGLFAAQSRSVRMSSIISVGV